MNLRRWRDSDREPFSRLNADARVMEWMPALLTPEESGRLVDRIEAHFEQHGFGLFAAELRHNRRFIGFIGLAVPGFVAAFTPCVEIGWRLDREFWGQGLTTEGARAVLRYAFESLGLKEVVSFTVPMNLRSHGVMERLGMVRDRAADFDHPKLPEGHALRRHVLYRIDRERWEQIADGAIGLPEGAWPR
jgi:RimJ/RimL family protein N-acetyltransferase